jgi:riboflavin transporter FmnP
MSVRRLVLLSLFAALAFVLMFAVQVPIMPAARYLTWDPADCVALLAAMVYGPVAGIWVQAVKDLLFLLLRGGSPFGPLADFLAGGTFVAVAAAVAGRGAGGARLALGIACGALARAAVMIPGNLVILPLEFGMRLREVLALQAPVFVPFNLLKSAINGVLAWVILRTLRKRLPLTLPS